MTTRADLVLRELRMYRLRCDGSISTLDAPIVLLVIGLLLLGEWLRPVLRGYMMVLLV